MGKEKSFYSGTLSLNYYEGEPNGPKLLLLPGFVGGIWSFRDLVPFLEDRYQVFI